MKTIDKKSGKAGTGQKPESAASGTARQSLVQSVARSAHPFHEIWDLIDIKRKRVELDKGRHLVFSSLGLALSMLFVVAMFEWRHSEDLGSIQLSANADTFDDLMEIPQTEQQAPPPPQVQAPQIVEVSDDEIIEQVEVNLDIDISEDTRVIEVVYTQAEALPEESAEEIFTIVEEQPLPRGGMQAFYQFVAENLKYPTRASRTGIEGRVFVQFVVEKDGTLTDVQVVRGIGGGCDEEAIRVVSLAPKWNPGKQRGRPVRVRMVLPIVFKLLDA